MTPETQRTLITVAGTLIAALIAAIAGVGGALMREKFLQKVAARTKIEDLQLSSLKDVLTGLYELNIALSGRLQSSMILEALEQSLSPKAIYEHAHSTFKIVTSAEDQKLMMDRILAGVDERRQEQERVYANFFEFQKEFLRLTGVILSAATTYGTYPPEANMQDHDLASDLHDVIAFVSSGDAKSYANLEPSNKKTLLFSTAKDIQKLIHRQTSGSARRKSNPAPLKLFILPDLEKHKTQISKGSGDQK